MPMVRKGTENLKEKKKSLNNPHKTPSGRKLMELRNFIIGQGVFEVVDQDFCEIGRIESGEIFRFKGSTFRNWNERLRNTCRS